MPPEAQGMRSQQEVSPVAMSPHNPWERTADESKGGLMQVIVVGI